MSNARSQVVARAEKLVRKANRMYHCRPGAAGEKPQTGVANAEDVKFLCVGHNASHEFYLGWDSEGNLWRASFGPNGNLITTPFDYVDDDGVRRVGEWEDEECEWRARPVQSEEDLGYLGHY